LTLTIIGSTLYERSISNLKENLIYSSMATLEQTKKIIESSLIQMENMSRQILSNPHFSEWIEKSSPNGNEDSPQDSLYYEQNIWNYLKYYSAYTTDFSVQIYTHDGRVFGNPLVNIRIEDYEELSNVAANKPYSWTLRLEDTQSGPRKENIFLVGKLDDIYTSKNLGIVLIQTEKSFFDRIFMNTEFQQGYMFLTDEDGKIVSATKNYMFYLRDPQFNKKAPQKFIDEILSSSRGRINSGEQTVIYDTISRNGWKLIAVVSSASLSKGMETIKESIITLGLLVILLSILFAVALSGTLIKPLKDLQAAIERFGMGQMDSRLHLDEKSDFFNIGTVFNKMADRINELMKITVAVEREKRKAELVALQSQINPHFLYNTLDSLRWMAQKQGQNEMSSIIVELATFFRIGLSRGKELITIRQEIEHTKSYLKIQQFRYEDKFVFNIDVENEILNLYIPKIVIQPLVENSIYHGIKNKQGQGTINIRGVLKDGKVILTVHDDGKGMTRERLKEVRKELYGETQRKRDIYGIKNINERIKRWFGDEYGLSIDSSADEGTIVTIIIPAVKERELYES